MGNISMRGVLTTVVLVGALWLPASALAAVERPGATTGAVSAVQPTTATFKGSVDPNGAPTTYFFQVGPTRLYGGQSATQSAGKGTKSRRVSAPVSGFAPATTYHYRLVAQNRKGLRFGKDRTFKTERQPLGVSLAATPNPIRIGDSTTLSGVLSGTGNSGRQVQLQANPWPYTSGFLAVGNNVVTTSTGSFGFTLLSVSVNTQYRVLMPAKPEVSSPIVVLGTTNKITRHAKVRRGSKRGRLHIWGTIRPSLDGAPVVIQRKRGSSDWVNVGQTHARHTSKGYSRYSKRLSQKHGGRYRAVVVDARGAHSPSVSKTVTRRKMRS